MKELWQRVEIKRVIATNGIKAMLSILNDTPTDADPQFL